MPRWPLLWLRQIGHYDRFIPLLVLPGPLLAAVLLRYRDRDAAFADDDGHHAATLVLRHAGSVADSEVTERNRGNRGFSWGAGIWRWYHIPHSFTEVGRWTVLHLSADAGSRAGAGLWEKQRSLSREAGVMSPLRLHTSRKRTRPIRANSLYFKERNSCRGAQNSSAIPEAMRTDGPPAVGSPS